VTPEREGDSKETPRQKAEISDDEKVAAKPPPEQGSVPTIPPARGSEPPGEPEVAPKDTTSIDVAKPTSIDVHSGNAESDQNETAAPRGIAARTQWLRDKFIRDRRKKMAATEINTAELVEDVRKVVAEVTNPRFDAVDLKLTELHSEMNTRFAEMNTRFAQILSRLPPAP
jgi:hypothetical protein